MKAWFFFYTQPGDCHARITNAQGLAQVTAAQPGGEFAGVVKEQWLVNGQENIEVKQTRDEDEQGKDEPVYFWKKISVAQSIIS